MRISSFAARSFQHPGPFGNSALDTTKRVALPNACATTTSNNTPTNDTETPSAARLDGASKANGSTMTASRTTIDCGETNHAPPPVQPT